MLRSSILIFLMLIAVSCSIFPNTITPAHTPSSIAIPALSSTVSIVTTTPTLISTPTSTAVSPVTGSTRIIVLQATIPASLAGPSSTVARTATLIPRTGWKTYTNATMHFAVDYPPDWSVRVQGNEVVFTSPQGATIQLTPIDPRVAMPSDEIVQPNTRCTNSVNPHGIDVRACQSTIGFSIDAYLDFKSAGRVETAVAISTSSRAVLEVFNALIESARIMP